jgi:hypothetical protein
MGRSETSPIRDFGDAYNRASDRYTGNADADLSDAGVPPDLFYEVARTCSAWATHKGAPREVATTLGFYVGVLTGIEWERARRRNA